MVLSRTQRASQQRAENIAITNRCAEATRRSQRFRKLNQTVGGPREETPPQRGGSGKVSPLRRDSSSLAKGANDIANESPTCPTKLIEQQRAQSPTHSSALDCPATNDECDSGWSSALGCSVEWSQQQPVSCDSGVCGAGVGVAAGCVATTAHSHATPPAE